MQNKEIETIRNKKINVRLSEADCELISRLCGEHNITVGELLENFIGDLVDGTYTNGSDERLYAQEYFHRCWFGMYPETTLLNWLLTNRFYYVEDFYSLQDDIKTGYEELESLKNNPEENGNEEAEYIITEIMDLEQKISEIRNKYLKSNPTADWEAEVEIVNKWWNDMEQMKIE